MTAPEEYEPVWDKDRIKQEQERDLTLAKILDGVKKGTAAPQYLLEDGLLRILKKRETGRINTAPSYLICAPAAMKGRLMRNYHDGIYSGHYGAEKTLLRIKQHFHWDGMARDIKLYCSSCISCQEKKTPGQRRAPLQKIPVSDQPFQLISADIIGPLPRSSSGNAYVLLVVDQLTRYAEAFALPDQKAKTIARALVDGVFAKHGIPDKLLTDRGKNFTSVLLKEVCQYLGVRQLQTSAFSPSTNGVCERTNGTIIRLLSHFVADHQRDWDEYLPLVLMSYISMPHSATKETPFFLLYGREMTGPFDDIIRQNPVGWKSISEYKGNLALKMQEIFRRAKENLEVAAETMRVKYDRKAKNRDFRVGESVMLFYPQLKKGRTKKLSKLWRGPFRVLTRPSPVNAQIQDLGTLKKQVVHTNRLKLFHHRPSESGNNSPLDSAPEVAPSETDRVTLSDPVSDSSGEEEEPHLQRLRLELDQVMGTLEGPEPGFAGWHDDSELQARQEILADVIQTEGASVEGSPEPQQRSPERTSVRNSGRERKAPSRYSP